MPQNKFYAYPNFFTLTAYGQSQDINEPVGWDDVRISLKRDKTVYGFNYELADSTTNLQFWNKDGGAGFIRSVYDTYAGDGLIVLTFGDIINGSRITQYTGTLNLNDYDRVPDDRDGKQYYVSCPVEKQSFDSKYRSRFETKVSLTDTVSLDGKSITPAPVINILLTSKEIYREAEYKSNEEYPPEFTFPTSNVNFIGDHEVWFVPDLQTNVKDELTGFSGGAPGVLKDDPVIDNIWQYKADEGGTLTVSYTDSFRVNVLNNFQNEGEFAAIRVYMLPYVRQYRAGALIEEYYPTALQNYYEKTNQPTGQDFVFDYTMPGILTHSLSVLQEDEVYIGIRMEQRPDEGYGPNADFRKCEARTIQSHITANQVTTQPATYAEFYKLIDAYKYAVESATGIANVVSAPVFETGCFANYAITNGYKIRRFPGTFPVQTSIKERAENMQALFNVGFGYQGTGFNDSRVIVQPMMGFFGGGRIAIIQPAYKDYDEGHDKSLQYNEATFGFSKYSDSTANTIDDYNSYREVLQPITSYKARKQVQATDIASSFLFEDARREQFKKSPSTSLPNDDAIFILNYNPQSLQPCTTEDFISVTGIYSPQTAYNLNLTPGQMQYNWAPFFNIGLFAKASTEVIKTPFVKQGKELTRQYDTSLPCFADMPATPLREGDDIALSEYKFGTRPHTPKRVTFTVAMNWNELNALASSLRGENGDDKDFGFITYLDDEGVYWDAHVYEMDYNPADRVGKLAVYKIAPANLATFLALLQENDGDVLQENEGIILL